MSDSDIIDVICETVTLSGKHADVPLSELSVTPRVEICLVIGGGGWCRALGESVDCASGDLFVFDASVPHGFFSSDEAYGLRFIKLSFYKSVLEGRIESVESCELLEGLFRDGMPYLCSVLNSEALGELCLICGRIRKELETKRKNYRLAVKNELMLLLVAIDRYMSLEDTVAFSKPKEWHLVFSAIGEVTKGYFDPSLTLKVVSERLYVSQSALSRAFLKVMGEPFHEYLRRVRIKEACALLDHSDMSNQEVAIHCGMRDLPSFYKAFKECMEMTPHQYRQMRKDGESSATAEIKAVTVEEIFENLKKCRTKNIKHLVEQAIAEGLSADIILSEGLIAGMAAIGERFKRNEVFVPEVLMAARSMNMGIETLRPLLNGHNTATVGRVCIGTVRGDLHDIGKNLVKIMMESRGIEVIDLGIDVPPERFVEAAIEKKCGLICCSALLTTTMGVMADVVKAADAAGIRPRVKIMIGGAPVSAEYCQTIGADIYADDAASAANAAEAILGQNKS